MKKVIALKIILICIFYIFIALVIVYAINMKPKSAYAKTVHAVSLENVVAADSSLGYEIKDISLISSKPFELIKIEGALYQTEDESKIAKVVLSSKDESFVIDAFFGREYGSSLFNSYRQIPTFLSYIPTDSIAEGEYKIGIYTDDGGEERIWWSDRMLLNKKG